jgi:hypothetical protein
LQQVGLFIWLFYLVLLSALISVLVCSRGCCCHYYCYSNFSLVIVAEDGSVWVMGMGEHDRNAHHVPLRVQTDFHLPPAGPTTSGSGKKAQSRPPHASAEVVDGKHYLVLPTGAGAACSTGASAEVPVQEVQEVQEEEVQGGDQPPYKLHRSQQRVALTVQEEVSAVAEGQQEEDVSGEGGGEDELSMSDEAWAALQPRRRLRRQQRQRAYRGQGLFEVVLHEGEGYLIELDATPPAELLPPAAASSSNSSSSGGAAPPKPLRLLQYATGWNHTVAVVDTTA